MNEDDDIRARFERLRGPLRPAPPIATSPDSARFVDFTNLVLTSPSKLFMSDGENEAFLRQGHTSEDSNPEVDELLAQVREEVELDSRCNYTPSSVDRDADLESLELRLRRLSSTDPVAAVAAAADVTSNASRKENGGKDDVQTARAILGPAPVPPTSVKDLL
ncbi:hypothetical protein HDU82_001877, partial [Entophlyctis luteolus]